MAQFLRFRAAFQAWKAGTTCPLASLKQQYTHTSRPVFNQRPLHESFANAFHRSSNNTSQRAFSSFFARRFATAFRFAKPKSHQYSASSRRFHRCSWHACGPTGRRKPHRYSRMYAYHFGRMYCSGLAVRIPRFSTVRFKFRICLLTPKGHGCPGDYLKKPQRLPYRPVIDPSPFKARARHDALFTPFTHVFSSYSPSSTAAFHGARPFSSSSAATPSVRHRLPPGSKPSGFRRIWGGREGRERKEDNSRQQEQHSGHQSYSSGFNASTRNKGFSLYSSGIYSYLYCWQPPADQFLIRRMHIGRNQTRQLALITAPSRDSQKEKQDHSYGSRRNFSAMLPCSHSFCRLAMSHTAHQNICPFSVKNRHRATLKSSSTFREIDYRLQNKWQHFRMKSKNCATRHYSSLGASLPSGSLLSKLASPAISIVSSDYSQRGHQSSNQQGSHIGASHCAAVATTASVQLLHEMVCPRRAKTALARRLKSILDPYISFTSHRSSAPRLIDTTLNLLTKTSTANFARSAIPKLVRSKVFQPSTKRTPFSRVGFPTVASPSFSTQSSSRSFSSSARRDGLHVIAHVLSNPQMLHKVTLVARIMLSVFPLALRSRWLHLYRAKAPNFFNTKAVTWSLLLAPIFMLLGVLAANLSRTPISGRPRLLMMSPEVEEQIVQQFYQSSAPSTTNAPACVQWYHVLRQLLGEDKAPSGTLLGGKVMEPLHDWRQQYLEGILSALESNLGQLQTESQQPVINGLAVPSVAHSLPRSPARRNYSILLVDRPEVNAFSFGWSPQTQIPDGASPGVIVVFTGLLDSILSSSTADMAQSRPQPKTLLPFLHQSKPARPQPAMPTPEQTRQIAVLLSHELAHLLLGHTLEAYANRNLVWPQIRRMVIDVGRSLVWPVSAALGPFVNDAVYTSTNQLVLPPHESDTECWLEELRSSSFSRQMELEADSVSLRLLANAGIDPVEAQRFWERRQAEEQKSGRSAAHQRAHSNELGCWALDGQSPNGHTHPSTSDRLKAISAELQRWREGTAGSWRSLIFS